MGYIIEIATSDFVTTQVAVEGKADRIELCANLAEGGTTPSLAMIKKCREAFAVELFPIIRPRGGDFLYSAEEYEILYGDAMSCKELGCDGIVVGMLNRDGSLDAERMRKLVDAVYPLGVTFHRAFDRCLDPFTTMEQLIGMGCERILTSGQQSTAPEGVELIAELNQKSGGRIIIMPGSGVRSENIRMLAERTGCTEFHSSLRGKINSQMEFIHPAFASSSESYSNNHIDKNEVLALRESLG